MLTDKQIEDLWHDNATYNQHTGQPDVVKFARVIELAAREEALETVAVFFDFKYERGEAKWQEFIANNNGAKSSTALHKYATDEIRALVVRKEDDNYAAGFGAGFDSVMRRLTGIVI